jgi:hypothetical protein
MEFPGVGVFLVFVFFISGRVLLHNDGTKVTIIRKNRASRHTKNRSFRTAPFLNGILYFQQCQEARSFANSA